jgi:hypothetical protein
MFRFRYRPGTNGDAQGPRLGTGNNFYLDRIHFSEFPAGIDDKALASNGFTLSPNPTSGATNVVLTGNQGATTITVMDVTGKVVYRTDAQATGAVTQVEIPGSALTVKGLYLVQVSNDKNKQTQKLVVY